MGMVEATARIGSDFGRHITSLSKLFGARTGSSNGQ
jgi:hypothetical protein